MPEYASDDDIWKAHNAASKERRARNREQSPKILQNRRIPFTVHNNGWHLVVMGSVDFWPGTGLWRVRNTKQQGRGVMNLIRMIRNTQPDDQESLG